MRNILLGILDRVFAMNIVKVVRNRSLRGFEIRMLRIMNLRKWLLRRSQLSKHGG